jgi:hypothetical protein
MAGAPALAKDHMEIHLPGDMDARVKRKGATHIDLRLFHGRDHQCDRDRILGLVPLLDEVVVAPRARDSAGDGAPVTVATGTAVAVTEVGVQLGVGVGIGTSLPSG